MLVTAVEPRRRSMSALYIDGEYAMKLDTVTLLENGIRAGTEITDEQLHILIQKSEVRRAKERALNLITYRDHSKKELFDKIRRDCSPEIAEETAQKMEELGLVDDEAFATRYANQLLHKKHLSPRGIRYKLREKGISDGLIQQIIESLDYDTYEEIKAVLEKKYPNYAEDEKIKKRAISALQRLGWSWSDIKEVMSEDY